MTRNKLKTKTEAQPQQTRAVEAADPNASYSHKTPTLTEREQTPPSITTTKITNKSKIRPKIQIEDEPQKSHAERVADLTRQFAELDGTLDGGVALPSPGAVTATKNKTTNAPKTRPKPRVETKAQPTKSHCEKVAELTAQFAELFGTNASRVQGWRDLCEDVGVEVGTSITQCKKHLKAVNVNIWDLMAAKERGEKPRQFASKILLAKDLGKKGRRFPLKAAKANGFLTGLLVQLHF